MWCSASLLALLGKTNLSGFFIDKITSELLLLFPVLPEGMVPTGFPIRSLTKGILFYFY